MARREKKVGGDPTLMFILLGGSAIIGIVLVVVFASLKKSNPIIEPDANDGIPDYIVAAPAPDDILVESSNFIKTDDPAYNAFQIWRQAREIARKDPEKAIRMCEDTVKDVPEYAGDAYFHCVQAIEYYLETKLYANRAKSKAEMPISKSQAKAWFDREFEYYNKALEAYSKPGAKTFLGVTKSTDEQIRRIKENMKNKRDKIIPWWLDRLPD